MIWNITVVKPVVSDGRCSRGILCLVTYTVVLRVHESVIYHVHLGIALL